LKVLFYIVATVAILCGFVFPQAGKYTVLIPHLIILILFFNFLDLKVDPRQIIRKELLITFLLSFIAMPLMTYYGLAAGFAEPFRIGLLLVACDYRGAGPTQVALLGDSIADDADRRTVPEMRARYRYWRFNVRSGAIEEP